MLLSALSGFSGSVHPGGPFQHRVVDGAVVAERKGLLEAGCKGSRTEAGQGRQHGGGARQVLAQLVEQNVAAPEKHAGIPKEIAGFEVAFGFGQLGFFVESAYRQGGASGGASAGEFNVAVAGFGPAGLNADHHEVAAGGGLQGGPDDGAVRRDLADHVVGGEYAHHRVGVQGVQDLRRQADGGRGVALHGFGQYLIPRNLGDLLNNDVAKVVVGQHPQALGRDQRRQPVHRGLDQAALADHVEHLLGGALAAARPEARTAPSGEDEAVMMAVHVISGGTRESGGRSGASGSWTGNAAPGRADGLSKSSAWKGLRWVHRKTSK